MVRRERRKALKYTLYMMVRKSKSQIFHDIAFGCHEPLAPMYVELWFYTCISVCVCVLVCLLAILLGTDTGTIITLVRQEWDDYQYTKRIEATIPFAIHCKHIQIVYDAMDLFGRCQVVSFHCASFHSPDLAFVFTVHHQHPSIWIYFLNNGGEWHTTEISEGILVMIWKAVQADLGVVMAAMATALLHKTNNRIEMVHRFHCPLVVVVGSLVVFVIVIVVPVDALIVRIEIPFTFSFFSFSFCFFFFWDHAIFFPIRCFLSFIFHNIEMVDVIASWAHQILLHTTVIFFS